MPEVTHNSHYCQQAYLKRWSRDGINIFRYDILVPNANIAVWRLKAIRSSAVQPDLYTSCFGGKESDAFEHWIEEHFETPSMDALTKAVDGKPLSPSDWKQLARYLAAQLVRTPSSLAKFLERQQQRLQNGWFDEQFKEAMEKAEQLVKAGHTMSESGDPHIAPLKRCLKYQIEEQTDGQAAVEHSVLVGRASWQATAEFLLTGSQMLKTLMSHKWSLIEAPQGHGWFTSDNPALCINHYGSGRYDLGGGVGKQHSDIMMPLSPRYLLFAEVGKSFPSRFHCPDKVAAEMREMIAAGAWRHIFANEETLEVARYRPRCTDMERYKEEIEMWADFQKRSGEAEREWASQ